jgi:formylglycine-generating enzyme required for sulfatase activity
LIVIAVGWAVWYFGIELPDERQAALLSNQRLANARSIPDLNLDLAWIPPGDFGMGTKQNILIGWYQTMKDKVTRSRDSRDHMEDNQRPLTWVTLTQPFWLGRTVVTQGQWLAVMGTKPSEYDMGSNWPVDNISWADAMAFCKKLTERERTAGRLPAGYAYTLPTEAQWEYACRAGRTGEYSGDLPAKDWYIQNGGTINEVAKWKPNAWGLYDMDNDVWEWCWDLFGDYPGGEVTDPHGSSLRGNWAWSSEHVIRGGGGGGEAAGLRSARRNHSPDYSSTISFRVALCHS